MLIFNLQAVIFIFGALLLSFSTSAQDIPQTTAIAYWDGNTHWQAQVNWAKEKQVKANQNKQYYYYHRQKVDSRQGGYTGMLLDGEAKMLNADLSLVSKGEFKNGLKHGTWMKWYPDGKLWMLTNWKLGVKEGKEYQYQTDGTLIRCSKYRNNLLHGKTIIYENGEWKMTIRYKKGVARTKGTSFLKDLKVKMKKRKLNRKSRENENVPSPEAGSRS